MPLEATGVGAPLGWVVEDTKESVTEKYSTTPGRRPPSSGEEAGLSPEENKKFGDDAENAANAGYDEGTGRQSGCNPPAKSEGN